MTGDDLYEPLEGGAYRNESWQAVGRPAHLPAVSLSLSNEITVRQALAAALTARLGAERKAFAMPDGTSIVLDAVVMAPHLDLRMTIWLEALFHLDDRDG